MVCCGQLLRVAASRFFGEPSNQYDCAVLRCCLGGSFSRRLRFTMQRYYICRGRLGDDGRWRAMAAHFVPTSWFAQVFNYYFHLPWRKALAGVLVAGVHQLLLYRLASFYPRHEVVFSHARAAVREVHERKFLLGVCANLEILGHSFLLSKDYYLSFCLGINLSRDFGILRIIICLYVWG